jgi:hypothetical protein
MKSDHVRFSVLAADRLQPPTGHYNCHGLVFAARRANIPAAGDDIDIAQLLRADGYERVIGVPSRATWLRTWTHAETSSTQAS